VEGASGGRSGAGRCAGILLKGENKMVALRVELEVQWENTEQASKVVEELKQDRHVLQNEVIVLEQNIENLELEWNESNNKRTIQPGLHSVTGRRQGQAERSRPPRTCMGCSRRC